MTSVSSASSSAAYTSQKSMFSKLDTDQNGSLTEDEFVSGRPKDVSKEQASALYARIDTGKTGALNEDQFDEAMPSNRPDTGLQSLLSGDAMAVLMLMSQQGGMPFGGDTQGAGNGQPSIADIYADMDADGDGKVTEAEFVAARPDDVSEDGAKGLFASIDTEGSGSITEEQFADSIKRHGGPQGGPPPGGGDAASTDEIYDALDTNKDGVVSEEEFLAAHPADVTDEQAAALFKSIDTDNKGSIAKEQFSDFMNPSDAASGTTAAASKAADLTKGIDDLITMLESISAALQSATETEAA